MCFKPPPSTLCSPLLKKTPSQFTDPFLVVHICQDRRPLVFFICYYYYMMEDSSCLLKIFQCQRCADTLLLLFFVYRPHQINPVKMSIEVSYTSHSHIIGKGGRNINAIMRETATKVHFPDENRLMCVFPLHL